MKIVLDTNIVLDTLAKREPFFANSNAVLKLVAEGKVGGAVSANTLTDIYYILRKHLDKETIIAALKALMELLEILDVTRDECLSALDSPMNDFEDALLASCAGKWQADCIVTRNKKDFKSSPVKAVIPEEFLDNEENFD